MRVYQQRHSHLNLALARARMVSPRHRIGTAHHTRLPLAFPRLSTETCPSRTRRGAPRTRLSGRGCGLPRGPAGPVAPRTSLRIGDNRHLDRRRCASQEGRITGGYRTLEGCRSRVPCLAPRICWVANFGAVSCCTRFKRRDDDRADRACLAPDHQFPWRQRPTPGHRLRRRLGHTGQDFGVPRLPTTAAAHFINYGCARAHAALRG
mmetsp:Transcript_28637/g.92496  ORF Transcript_28637/g.92496 Transcript_28637/m.92496 type:complete len:207 (-) Transcript_28637:361-981(-)